MSEKRKIISSDPGSALKAVLLISAVVMAVMLTVGGLYLLGNRSSGSDKNGDGSVQRYFSELIDEYEGRPHQTNVEIPEIELAEAFSLYSTAHSSYYQECDVTYSGADSVMSTKKKQIIKDGDKYFVRTFDKNLLLETIKCDGERVLIINELTGKSTVLSAAENSLEELAGLPNHSSAAEHVKEYLSDREKSSLSSLSCSIKRAKAMNSLILDITYKDTGLTEKYYYYLDFGLIYQCESYIVSGSQRIPCYKMTTTAFSSDISEYANEDSFSVEG